MASTNSIKAGEAFIVIRAIDKTGKVLAEIGQKFERFGRSIRNIGLAFGAIGGGIMAAFIKPVKNAMKVQEEMNQFFNVFGTTVGKDVELRLKALGAETGRSAKRMYGYAANFGKIIRGYGATTKAAGEMTAMLVKMGVDFSSFNDIMDDTREGSMGRFKSALSGSAEVLDQFGVAAKESALGPALKKMFGVGTRSASELQKATARTFLIFQSMKRQNALGDAVRTAGDLANQLRNFKDLLFDISVSIGTALLKPLEGIMKLIFKIGYAVEDWIDNNQDIVRMVAVIGAAFSAIAITFVTVGVAIQFIGWTLGVIASISAVLVTLWTALGAVVAFVTGNVYLLIGVFVALLASLTVFTAHFAAWGADFYGWLTSIGGSIWKAFSAGKIKLSWDIFMKALELGWSRVASLANDMWSAWASLGIRAWAEVIAFALSAIEKIRYGLTSVWFSFQAAMYNIWGDIFAWWADKVEALGGHQTAEFLRVAADTSKNMVQGQEDAAAASEKAEEESLARIQATKMKFLETWADARDQVADNYTDEEKRLAKELFELEKQANKAAEEKAFPDPTDEEGGGEKAGKMLKDILPAALEKGTSAAARKAEQNRLAQQRVAEMQRKKLIEEAGTTNDLLSALNAAIGSV